ncbi:hypothetical protein [Mycolicibacterium obuense]|uniref:hypothetical protein n=1 Tax=Mycolicibacterium obuense TaxID=1807 RepID=UPI00103CD1C3|nr:hypothetical protein [Mycolicibacterium obuense]
MDKYMPPAAADPCSVGGVDLGWLTQPVATVLAACIALVAAGVAYTGVLKTTRTTKQENRRTERVAVLSEGLAAVDNFSRAIYQIARTSDPGVRAAIMAVMATERLDEINDAISLAIGKFGLFGFTDVRKKTNVLAAMYRVVWDAAVADPTVPIDMSIVDPHYKAATEAFRKAFAELK